MELIVKFLPLFGVVALIFVFLKSGWVSKQAIGNDKMARIAKNIASGAMAFLKAEYKVLAIFVAAVAVLLFFKGTNEVGSNGMVAVSFIIGAICSALAGFIGMKVGLGVVGLGILGLSGLFMIYQGLWPGGDNLGVVLNVLSGFSLGASSIASLGASSIASRRSSIKSCYNC